MNYLLYQAYGNKANINEAKFSIISFCKVSASSTISTTCIVIYTDQPEQFELFKKIKSIIIQHITQETIRNWYGPLEFAHRAKIKIIEDFFFKYPAANLLYVDTDTYFTADLADIFSEIANGTLFMHAFEGVAIKNHPDSMNALWVKRLQKLFKYTFAVGDKKIKIPESTPLWNAGALGINSSYAFLINEVEALTDSIYKTSQVHIAEQIAFCYTLQSQAKVKGLDKVIFHYWNFKELRPVLESFFENNKHEPLSKLIDYSSALDPVELIRPKMAYEGLPGWRRAIRKVFVKGRWDRSKLEAASQYTIS